MSCLDGMRLSSAQQGAVDDDSARVLVAAGAGSGKTSLLVAYFLRALLDEGVPADRLVAVTFTRKAAGELAQRIRHELEERGESDLARSLDGGAIGTIHSLCRRILRQNALEAGVDPGFAVLESDSAELLKREAFSEVWEQAVREADVAALAALAEHERTLRNELVPLYERLRSVGYEVPRVDLPAPPDGRGARRALEQALRSALEAGAAQERITKTLAKALEVMGECLEWACSADPRYPSADDLICSRGLFPSRIASFDTHLDPVRRALTEYRGWLALSSLSPLVAAMNDLLGRFHDRYGLLKQQRGVLDFADLELQARRFLSGGQKEDSPLFGDGSRVMIDEFQDTNELQCSILESLGAESILMVGDERQSIYRFRGADVEVFTRRRDAVSPRALTDVESATGADTAAAATPRAADDAARAADEALACRLHRLDRNYRSRAEVLVFVNHLFSQEAFFGADFVPLECGTEAEDGEREGVPPVEILAVKREAKGGGTGSAPIIQEAEARAVAWRICELLHEDGVEPRDVVILTPALTHGELYQRALRARDIPAYVVRGKGYYSRDEITDVRCLLRILLNPHDDLALVTVLRSPLVGLSDDALYLLGRRSRRNQAQSLWEAARQGSAAGLPPEDARRLDDLTGRLAVLSERVGRPGLASLIDDAITSFGYDLSVLAASAGKRRFANVHKLMRLADEFEQLQGPDLAGFVEVLSTMDEVGGQEGNAATLSEEENVVRVMTVHQAKGLEFPVVVLTGLGSGSGGRSHPSFVVDNAGRVGVSLKGSCRDTYEDHDLCWGPAVEIVQMEQEHDRREDVRLLYVAMTRAKSRLLLVGAAQTEGRKDNSRLGAVIRALGRDSVPEPGGSVALPAVHALLRGVSYVDVIAPAEADAMSAEPLVEPSEGPGTLAGADSAVGTSLDLAGPVFPQDGLKWTKTPDRLSFSGLAFYLECPRRYYLERLHGLRLDLAAGSQPPVSGDDGGAAEGQDEAPRDQILLDRAEQGAGREVGLLVHALLERSRLDGPRPSLEQLRGLAEEVCSSARGRYEDAAAQNAGRPSEGGCGLPGPADLERALQLTSAFWLSPVVGRSGLQRALKEAPFWFLQDGLFISGVMDLVWETDGGVSIVDYKTNSLRGRSAEGMASMYDLQACLYALAALRAGADEVQMELLFLECPETPVAYRWGRVDVAALERKLEEALQPLRGGEYPAREGAGCVDCISARLCGSFATRERTDLSASSHA